MSNVHMPNDLIMHVVFLTLESISIIISHFVTILGYNLKTLFVSLKKKNRRILEKKEETNGKKKIEIIGRGVF